MRLARHVTALLLLVCAAAAPAAAQEPTDVDQDIDYGIPDYAYDAAYRDLSELPDVPRRTTFTRTRLPTFSSFSLMEEMRRMSRRMEA